MQQHEYIFLLRLQAASNISGGGTPFPNEGLSI